LVFALITLYKFKYQNDKIVEINNLSESNTKWIIRYNAQNRVSRMIYIYHNDTIGYRTNEYGNSGNISSIYTRNSLSLNIDQIGNVVSSTVNEHHILYHYFSYDNYINYRKLLGLPNVLYSQYYTDVTDENEFLLNDIETFSKNNIVSGSSNSITTGSSGFNLNNKYDKEHKLIKSGRKEYKYIERK
jgi:hypothetical protein